MRRLAPSAALLLTLLLGTAAVSSGRESSRSWVFEHVNVVPMTREIVLEDQTVIVREGRIAALGRADALQAPPGVARIDGTGKFLVPGLTDMHVHLDADRGQDLGMYLAHGVTTVRNMNGSRTHLEWRDAVRRGERTGPRIVTASQFTSRDDVPAGSRPPRRPVRPCAVSTAKATTW